MALRNFFIFLAINQALGQTNYCQISPSHTLCQFLDFGRNCGPNGPVFRGLTEPEKQMVVDVHNRYRSLVAQGRETRGSPGPQKPAANMLEMTWDDELELIAQRWADQCNFGHDTERRVSRFSVGQNVYEASDFNEGPLNLQRAIDSWYNEVDDVNNNLVDRYQFIPSTGHYTQMVWAQTFKIGCGYTAYRRRNFVKKFLVCNYGDAGNLLGSEMYEVGRPCSRCPANICSRKFPGLCPVPGEENPISNSSFIEMTNINNNIDEEMRPSIEETESGFRPMFVDNNEVETFRPVEVTTRPPPSTASNLRPVISSNTDPDLFVFSARPTLTFPQQNVPTFFRPERPGFSFFNRFFNNILQG